MTGFCTNKISCLHPFLYYGFLASFAIKEAKDDAVVLYIDSGVLINCTLYPFSRLVICMYVVLASLCCLELIVYILLVLEPDSINVIVDSSVQFSCTGTGDAILFLANGTSVNNLAAEGFMQTPNVVLDESNKLIRRNLTLMSARADLNNTMIKCFIEDLTLSEHNISDATIIQIQGKNQALIQ